MGVGRAKHGHRQKIRGKGKRRKREMRRDDRRRSGTTVFCLIHSKCEKKNPRGKNDFLTAAACDWSCVFFDFSRIAQRIFFSGFFGIRYLYESVAVIYVCFRVFFRRIHFFSSHGHFRDCASRCTDVRSVFQGTLDRQIRN